MKRTAIILLTIFITLTASAIDIRESDTTAQRLSKEFLRYYIDGNEEQLYTTAEELFAHMKKQPVYDYHLIL